MPPRRMLSVVLMSDTNTSSLGDQNQRAAMGGHADLSLG